MDATMAIVVTGLTVGLICGGFGSWIATQKHRDPGEGMLLGFVFGPIGLLIEAMLPNKPAPDRQSNPASVIPPHERRDEFRSQRRLRKRG